MNRLIAIALLFLGSLPAMADCVQEDLAGVWDFAGVSGNVGNKFFEETAFCTLRFAPAGGVVSTRSTCEGRTDLGKQSVNITGGKFTVNQFCGVFGRLRFCNDLFCDTLIIDKAKLSGDRNTLVLIGRFAGQTNGVIQLTGVKQ